MSATEGAQQNPPSSASADRGPIGTWSFLGFAITSFGGPLALAALAVPVVIAGAGGQASQSAGLANILAAAVFVVPLLIWLRYAREISSSGGLYAFVEAAAGRRIALVQAAIWAFSYLLYAIYTTVQIVYDLLPAIFPGVIRWQTSLALLIPVAIAGVMLAGRRTALIAIGAIAASQLALVLVLDVVTLANVTMPASTFRASAPTSQLAAASAQTSLLYICGSLPLFLGGELRRPVQTMRRGLVAAFLVTALVIVLAVAPLAAAPGFLHAEVPGVAIADQFVGRALGSTIGIGVAVSTAGVILVEFFALTRLAHAVTGRSLRNVTAAIAAVAVLAAPISLVDPEGFYNTLAKPSLVALWLSQLIVFLVFPRFAWARGQRLIPACALSLGASAFAIYGIYITLHGASS